MFLNSVPNNAETDQLRYQGQLSKSNGWRPCPETQISILHVGHGSLVADPIEVQVKLLQIELQVKPNAKRENIKYSWSVKWPGKWATIIIIIAGARVFQMSEISSYKIQRITLDMYFHQNNDQWFLLSHNSDPWADISRGFEASSWLSRTFSWATAEPDKNTSRPAVTAHGSPVWGGYGRIVENRRYLLWSISVKVRPWPKTISERIWESLLI